MQQGEGNIRFAYSIRSTMTPWGPLELSSLYGNSAVPLLSEISSLPEVDTHCGGLSGLDSLLNHDNIRHDTGAVSTH